MFPDLHNDQQLHNGRRRFLTHVHVCSSFKVITNMQIHVHDVQHRYEQGETEGRREKARKKEGKNVRKKGREGRNKYHYGT